VDGKNFRLADEVRYILRRAAEHDGRVVTIGQLVLFSTETGDAWLLDPSDQLAARLARDGDPEPFHIEENETTFTIDWKGSYRIDIRLHGSRNRAARHHSRISDAQTNSNEMMLKISNIFG
jgi:hypothetical protein